jgi:hypothetical protein
MVSARTRTESRRYDEAVRALARSVYRQLDLGEMGGRAPPRRMGPIAHDEHRHASERST